MILFVWSVEENADHGMLRYRNTGLTIYNWTDIAHINEIKFNTMNTERMV